MAETSDAKSNGEIARANVSGEALDRQSNPPKRTPPDYALLARRVIREGKPFRHAAIEAGYSQNVADSGLKALMKSSKPVSEAIVRESEGLNLSLDKLKPMAIMRLYREIADIDSSLGIKAIELAGKFKETDWFVRNSDGHMGVFLTVQDQTPDVTLDVLSDYKPE
jgi:hypothetical protein